MVELSGESIEIVLAQPLIIKEIVDLAEVPAFLSQLIDEISSHGVEERICELQLRLRKLSSSDFRAGWVWLDVLALEI